MSRAALCLALLVALSCGSSPSGQSAASTKPSVPAEPVRDETHRFDKTGLVESKVVTDQLGGKEFMPGGNLAEYERDGVKYQVFFALRRNAEQAMFLAMDYRDTLSDSEFILHFGGFFGMDGETPTLIFSKDKYVIGVTGLEFDDADQAGRLIAAFLN